MTTFPNTSDTNRVQLAYIAEDTFGVQKTGSNLKLIRYTGETLKQDSSFVTSDEIRSDRQISGQARTKIAASGKINGEMSYGAYDDFLVAALMSAGWSTPVTVGPLTTISAAASDNSISDSANGFGSIVAGQWVHISGFSTNSSSIFAKVVTATAAKITLSGVTLVDEAVGGSITVVMGAQIVNGTTKQSFNIERKYTDMTDEFALFVGMMIGEMGLNVTVESKITCDFTLTGKKETSETDTGGTGYVAAPTNTIMDTTSNIDGLLENQDSVDGTDFTMQLVNNLRGRPKLGTEGAFDVGTGECDVKGTLKAYFVSKTLYNKYLNKTASSLSIILIDGAGNAYVIDLPYVEFSGGNPRGAEGKNQDVFANLNYQAFMDATEGVTIRIVKFPAA